MKDTYNQTEKLAWVSQLLDKPLPAVTNNGPLLLRSMEQRVLSFQDIGRVIGEDPILALHLLNQANLEIRAKEGIVKTLNQAISLLGMEFLENMLKTLPAPENASIPGVVGYQRSITVSFCAAKIAESIAEWKQPQRSGECYWTALFYGIPIWFLWRYTPKKMQVWRDCQSTSPNARTEIERKIFGTNFANIWQQIQRTYSLPEELTEKPLFADKHAARMLIKLAAYCPPKGLPGKPQAREELLFQNSPSFIAGFSNILAFQANHSLYSPLVDKLCKVLATVRQVTFDQASSWLKQIIVASAREQRLPCRHFLAEQLIWGPGDVPGLQQSVLQQSVLQQNEGDQQKQAESAETSSQPIPVPKPAPEPEPESKSEPKPVNPDETKLLKDQSDNEIWEKQALQKRHGNKALFNEITQTMLFKPSVFKDNSELMNGAARCITYGIGLKTSVIALINQQRTRLKGYYAAGTQDRPELAKINLDLNSSTIFRTLMKKPSGIWVKPDSSRKVQDMIPEDFSEINQTSDFFLMSCFVRNRPVALFYADAGPDALRLTEYEYDCFKKVCSSTSQVLVYLAQRNKIKTK